MNTRPDVTLKDLAVTLGLGVTTVSDILLRGKTNYHDDTIKRVREEAERRGYRPNAFARGIRGGKSQTVGILMTSNILDPYFAETLNELEKGLESQGFRVILAITENEPAKEARALDFMESRRVDGLIIGPVYPHPWDTRPETRYQSRIPTVLFLAARSERFDTVGFVGGGRGVGRQVAEHLLAKGHRRIGYHMCHTDIDATSGDQPYRGFYQALAKEGLYREDWVWIETRPLADISYARMKYELAKRTRDELPTAFVCHNDHCAIGALAAIRESGFRVPEDFSLVSVDNITASAFTDPPLTTLDLKPAEVARKASRLLLERMKDPTRPTRQLRVRPELIERQSVAHL